MSDELVMVLECDAELVQGLLAELREAKVELESSPEKNLDGSQIPYWIVFASLLVKTAPVFLDALTRFLTRDRLKSIKMGDLVIENPRPEDVPALVAAINALEKGK